MTSPEKFLGCLLGLAIGDALGMPYAGQSQEERSSVTDYREFVASERVVALQIPLGELGEPEEEEEPLGAGQWTDDTQLALALAECLLEERGQFVPEAWAHYLVRWLNNLPRVPGLSTLQAAFQLRAGGYGEPEEASDPEGAGCSPASRVAPVALLYSGNPAQCHDLARQQAQITHGHPDAQAAALAVAEAISLVLPVSAQERSALNGAQLLLSLKDTVYAASPAFSDFARCLELAHSLLEDDVETATAIRVLGSSAWSREAVPCALYCVARTPSDFETTLLNAIRFTTDASDSIAAIAGAISGALNGVEAIPQRWREGVENTEDIQALALALHSLRLLKVNGNFRE